MGDLADLKLAIIDVETTGPSATGDRIIEIAIQRIEEGKIVRTFSSLVDPQQRIPSYIESLTGITNEDVAGAPTFRSIHEQMDSLLNGCIFVAHNVRF
ncbi:MAG: DNA polymerase III subunit epsilon, partial [Candidatus Omnitrophica bacterium]|nr:DNA polymerase III subunit epsilon [Candidatus Omnitrophota bacterium]